jgi:hypothetical protein
MVSAALLFLGSSPPCDEAVTSCYQLDMGDFVYRHVWAKLLCRVLPGNASWVWSEPSSVSSPIDSVAGPAQITARLSFSLES